MSNRLSLQERTSVIALAGIAIWLAAFLAMPAPMAARILLLAPLVVVPRLLSSVPDRPWIARLAGWPALLAAVPLVVSFGSPQGPLAAALAAPWLLVALIAAVAAIRHGLAHLPAILRPAALPDLGLDVVLGFWAVGAVFAIVDRLGVETGFSPTIVLLTATHFHFAGFGLLGLTSLLSRSQPTLRIPVVGLILGIPVTAAGFILASNPVSAIGALLVGLSGIGVGLALVVRARPEQAAWPSRLAGAALLVGMPMGIAWSFSSLFALSFLDIDTMIRTHGALNASAVLIGSLSYRGSRS